MVKMIKGKKGTDMYAFLLVILSFFIIWYAIITFLDKPGNLGFDIGAAQAKFVGRIVEGERELFYVDEVVKLAANKALLTLASSGGLKEGSCSKSGDYFIWDSKCRPDKKIVEQNFIHYFKQEFDQRKLPYDYPDYKLSNKRLIGEANKEIDIKEIDEVGTWGFKRPVHDEEGLPYHVWIKYKPKPNFAYDTGFDFGIFQRIFNKIKTDDTCRRTCKCFDGPDWIDIDKDRCTIYPDGRYEIYLKQEVVITDTKQPIVIKFKINDYNNL